LVALAQATILQPRAEHRLRLLEADDLPAADRKRLADAGKLDAVRSIGIAGPGKLRERALSLSPGRRLLGGKLRILVHVVENETQGASIQLDGTLPGSARKTFGRYDLDIVPLGSNQLTHFDAHFHFGEDPDDESAPRWPTLFLDPEEALDILVHTWFPNGPGDVLPDG
jgi:hypothetical protein